MNVAKVVTSLVAIGLFGVAVAQDEARVQIEVKTDDGHGGLTHIALDGDDLGVNLHDMQEGENQAQQAAVLVQQMAQQYGWQVNAQIHSSNLLRGWQNLVEGVVEVHRDPRPEGYGTIDRLGPGDSVSPLAASGSTVAVVELLP